MPDANNPPNAPSGTLLLGLPGSAYTVSNTDQSFVHVVINFDTVGRPAYNSNKNCMVIEENPNPVLKNLNAEIVLNSFFSLVTGIPKNFSF